MEYPRYFNIPIAIAAGVTSPVEPAAKRLINHRLRQADCGEYNPLQEDVLPELDSVITNFDSYPVTMSKLKKGLGITRSDFMIYYACFADEHNLKEVDVFGKFTNGAIKTIEKIEEVSVTGGGSVGLAKQLEIGLEEAKGDISEAVVYLALGTRAMARRSDGRIFGFGIDEKRSYSWKGKVKPFGYSGEFEDTAGDTYHFWHNVLAGIGREEKADFFVFRKLKQKTCDLCYLNTAKVTEKLRHKGYLKMDSWNTHETVDRLGYSVGRAFVGLYGNKRW